MACYKQDPAWDELSEAEKADIERTDRTEGHDAAMEKFRSRRPKPTPQPTRTPEPSKTKEKTA